MPCGFGPGLNAGVDSVWRVYSPSKRSGVPSCQCSRIALIASTHSRMCATGRPNSPPKRFSTCAFTCVPRPRRNRPPDSSCRS